MIFLINLRETIEIAKKGGAFLLACRRSVFGPRLKEGIVRSNQGLAMDDVFERDFPGMMEHVVHDKKSCGAFTSIAAVKMNASIFTESSVKSDEAIHGVVVRTSRIENDKTKVSDAMFFDESLFGRGAKDSDDRGASSWIFLECRGFIRTEDLGLLEADDEGNLLLQDGFVGLG